MGYYPDRDAYLSDVGDAVGREIYHMQKDMDALDNKNKQLELENEHLRNELRRYKLSAQYLVNEVIIDGGAVLIHDNNSDDYCVFEFRDDGGFSVKHATCDKEVEHKKVFVIDNKLTQKFLTFFNGENNGLR